MPRAAFQLHSFSVIKNGVRWARRDIVPDEYLNAISAETSITTVNMRQPVSGVAWIAATKYSTRRGWTTFVAHETRCPI